MKKEYILPYSHVAVASIDMLLVSFSVSMGAAGDVADTKVRRENQDDEYDEDDDDEMAIAVQIDNSSQQSNSLW